MPKGPQTLRGFTLRPFRGKDEAPRLTVTCAARRRERKITLRYALRGDIARLAVPAPDPSPGRRDRLWEETCLELFLAAEGSSRYWEFNLSPSGNWNVYRFTAYRTGGREEPAFLSLPFHVRREPAALRLSLELDLGSILPAADIVEAAASAVIRTLDGGTSHWALRHPGDRPDFHRRDGFTLRLPAGGVTGSAAAGVRFRIPLHRSRSNPHRKGAGPGGPPDPNRAEEA